MLIHKITAYSTGVSSTEDYKSVKAQKTKYNHTNFLHGIAVRQSDVKVLIPRVE